jgi:phage-related protein
VAANKQLRIVITGDADQATAAVRKLGGATGTLHSKMGSLTKNLAKLGLAFGGIMLARKVATYFKESAKAAMDDAKAKAILHAAMTNLVGATDAENAALDDYIEKTQAATGFTEEELRPGMVKLVTATKNVSKAQRLMSAAMDTATARGASLDTVVTALAKAQNGQMMSLQRLGFQTKDASGKALTFDQILRNLESAYGGATAAAADTLGGKMARLGLVFGEVKEGIGAAFLPILEKLANFLVAHMPEIEAFGKAFAEKLGGAFSWLYTNVLPVLQQVFEAVWPVIQSVVAGFIEWFQSSEGQQVIKALLNGLKSALSAFKDLWVAAWPLIKQILKVIAPLIVGPILLITNAIKVLTTALNALKRAWEWLVVHFGGSVGQSIADWGAAARGAGGTPSIGAHAEGGFITRPKVMLAGEAGPELLLPLTKPRRLQQLLAEAGLAGGGASMDIGPLIAEIRGLRAEVATQNRRWVMLAKTGALAQAGAL